MVAYDDKWTALTKGVEWLKVIARNCLKYQYQTVFLNLPPFYDLSPEELVAAHDACTNSDLFMCSSFVQPGVQTLLVLDNRFNEETGMLEEVVYAKEAIIERMAEDLAKLSSSEVAELTNYLTRGALSRYKAIREQQRQEEEARQAAAMRQEEDGHQRWLEEQEALAAAEAQKKRSAFDEVKL